MVRKFLTKVSFDQNFSTSQYKKIFKKITQIKDVNDIYSTNNNAEKLLRNG